MISVIIPVCNAASYMARAMDSVLANTYRDFEVILVENGSTDNTQEVCRRYVQADPRVRLMISDVKGLSHARNVALDAARGDYIMFIDGDDYVSPRAFERFMACVEAYDADLVFADHETGEQLDYVFSEAEGRVREWSKDDYFSQMFLRGGMRVHVVWNKLYHRDLIRNVRFDESLKFTEDRGFTIQCASRAKHLVGVDEILYYYWRGSSTSLLAYADTYLRMDMVRSLMLDMEFFRTEFPDKIHWQERLWCAILRTTDNRIRRCRKSHVKELIPELKPVAKEALRQVKKAKTLPRRDRFGFLLEHYSPTLYIWTARLTRRFR